MGCITSMNDTQGLVPINQLHLTANDLVIQKFGKITQDYVLKRPPIGRGSYGEVYKAVHNISETVRAVKVIRCNPEDQSKIVQEALIMKKLDHPNILKVYEFYQDDNYIYIVCELCTGGELYDKLKEQFTEERAAITMRQILSAVSYCHKNKIVHRDLKPENLLYQSNMTNSAIKLVDFGASEVIVKKFNQRYGTPYYIAPEILTGQYDEKCDVWSCGVILYILLIGYPPFQGAREDVIMKKVREGKFTLEGEDWDKISCEAKNLIRKMLQKEPKQRISAEDALMDVWIQKYNTECDRAELERALNNMRSFKIESKFQEAAWIFIVNNLTTNEEREELLRTFEALDLNHDGLLSKEELIKGYSKIMDEQSAIETVNQLMIMVDINNSNQIDYTGNIYQEKEFIMATANRDKLLNDSRLKKAFDMFDIDHNGSISKDEIRTILGGTGRFDTQVWDDMMKEVDQKEGGEITPEEFRNMMHRLI